MRKGAACPLPSIETVSHTTSEQSKKKNPAEDHMNGVHAR
jgi:hypothetical protein